MWAQILNIQNTHAKNTRGSDKDSTHSNMHKSAATELVSALPNFVSAHTVDPSAFRQSPSDESMLTSAALKPTSAAELAYTTPELTS